MYGVVSVAQLPQLECGFAGSIPAREPIRSWKTFRHHPNEDLQLRSKHKIHVINPGIAEVFGAFTQVRSAVDTVREVNKLKARYVMERQLQGIKTEIALREAKEITPEVVEKVRGLRAERHAKKAKVLEKIEEKLPKSDPQYPYTRAAALRKYLDEHGAEIIVEMERYTLGEIKAEVDICGSVKSPKASEFLRNYANAELTSEEMERYSEQGIAEVYTSAAEKFNELLIPGYASWASGGTPMEVISSAGSDIVLTLVGGKVVKIAWTGSKALYQGAKALGRELLIAKKPMVVEVKPWRLAEIEAGKTLGLGAKPQVKYQFGRDVTGSNPKGGYVILDFVDEARNACFEVKNYLLENRSSMISKIDINY